MPLLCRCLILTILTAVAGLTAQPAAKPRLLILTDIGGDPDDTQSLIRLVTYSNEFDVEGLIASAAGTPGELGVDIVKPELIREVVEAYGRVRGTLSLHAAGYPPVERLLDCIKSGNPKRGVGQLGRDKDTEGSLWIIRLGDRPDPRPLNIAIWGGSTELAQALWRVRNDRGRDGLNRFVGRLRVHSIAHQDDTGPWIVSNFPELFYVLSMEPDGVDRRQGAYRGMYLGGDESLTSLNWISAHVKTGHGPLGALYPLKTWTVPNPHGVLKEGDTPSWFYFLPNGLSDPEHPEWGGWGGRFRRVSRGLYRDAQDSTASVTDARATVWRWRPAYQNDFQARMDWCVKGYREANHPPVAALNGKPGRDVVRKQTRPGANVLVDAAGSSDLDGDRLSYRWWIYREAGTLSEQAVIERAEQERATVRIPNGSAGAEIHVILEATDSGTPPLTSYRRMILDVRP